MSNRPPKMDPRAPARKGVPCPERADYSDEVSDAQMERLRKFVSQDERAMGPLVHEFTW